MSILNIKLSKLRSPDSLLIKCLSFLKALVEIAYLIIRYPSTKSLKLASLILQVKPWYTMVSVPRLVNLYQRVEDANRLQLPGDIVECGTWNGGSAAMMGKASLDMNNLRITWVFDSFEGLPRPGERDTQDLHDFYFDGWCKGDTEKVQQIFNTLNLPPASLKIGKGWFDKTLPTAPVKEIAVLHIDSDWYDSVKVVLDCLYDKVVAHGYIVIDDYWVWEGCRKAVEDFLATRQLKVSLHSVAGLAVYFQKEA